MVCVCVCVCVCVFDGGGGGLNKELNSKQTNDMHLVKGLENIKILSESTIFQLCLIFRNVLRVLLALDQYDSSRNFTDTQRGCSIIPKLNIFSCR